LSRLLLSRPYSCSTAFHRSNSNARPVVTRDHCALQELGEMGHKFQFVTLAGFHALNHSMFELSRGYAERGMAAYSELQQREFASEKAGYTATRCASTLSLMVIGMLIVLVFPTHCSYETSVMWPTVVRSCFRRFKCQV